MAAVNKEKDNNSERVQTPDASSSTLEARPVHLPFAVDCSFTHMTLVDISKMELIRSHLFKNLPLSCNAYGLVQSLLKYTKEGRNATEFPKFV